MTAKKHKEIELASTAVVPAASFDLQQWGRDAALVASVAENLVKTSFVPDSFQGRALEATAAILTGQEIGLKPMAALRSIDIINGTPAMRAILLRALVQAHGHEIWTEESSSQRAVVAGRRRGSDKVERSVWDMDRARTQNLAQKPNWKTMPTSQLLARATSECARLVDADGILGIPYSTEELQDLDPQAPVMDAAPVRRASSSTRRKPLPEKVPAVEPGIPLEDLPEEVAGNQLKAELVAEAGVALADAVDEKVLSAIADADAEEYAAEQRAKAAEAFIDEPPIDWEPPLEESEP